MVSGNPPTSLLFSLASLCDPNKIPLPPSHYTPSSPPPSLPRSVVASRYSRDYIILPSGRESELQREESPSASPVTWAQVIL